MTCFGRIEPSAPQPEEQDRGAEEQEPRRQAKTSRLVTIDHHRAHRSWARVAPNEDPSWSDRDSNRPLLEDRVVLRDSVRRRLGRLEGDMTATAVLRTAFWTVRALAIAEICETEDQLRLAIQLCFRDRGTHARCDCAWDWKGPSRPPADQARRTRRSPSTPLGLCEGIRRNQDQRREARLQDPTHHDLLILQRSGAGRRCGHPPRPAHLCGRSRERRCRIPRFLPGASMPGEHRQRVRSADRSHGLLVHPRASHPRTTASL